MVLIFSKHLVKGFINAGNKNYTFVVFPAKDLEFSEFINLDCRLKFLLGDSFEKFLSDNEFHDVADFHDKFSDFVKRKISKTEDNHEWLQNPLKTCAFIKIIQEELKTSGEYIKSFNITNGTVTVEVTDSQLRSHTVNLQLSQHYQVEPVQVISHELPLKKGNITETSFCHILSIPEFCEKFSELVTCFQKFWNQMALIDSQCYVLDPSNPTYKHVHRRIKLTDTLSVILTFNPFFPLEKPYIKLLGCNVDVNHYQSTLQNNLEKDLWDNEEDVLYNLSNVLDITIPNKMELDLPDIKDLPEKNDCAICFSWRLKEEIPSEVCENINCRHMYHSTCLFNYLSSLPRNRDYFSKIQGECPKCSDSITCSVPKFI